MNDARLVGGLQGIRHRLEHAGGLLHRHGAVLPDDVPQGAALDVLHDDVGHRQAVDVLLAGIENGDDVGVVQLARVLGLAAEALTEVDVPRHVGAQHLHGDGAAQDRVVGLVHL